MDELDRFAKDCHDFLNDTNYPLPKVGNFSVVIGMGFDYWKEEWSTPYLPRNLTERKINYPTTDLQRMVACLNTDWNKTQAFRASALELVPPLYHQKKKEVVSPVNLNRIIDSRLDLCNY